MRRLPLWVSFIGLFALALLYVPLIGVVIQSFNASRLGLDWKGFTLKWYEQLWANEVIHEAAWNTLVIATVSTVISTVLGTALALAFSRFPWKRRAMTTADNVLYLPVVTPEIVMAAALVVMFSLLRHVHAMFDFGLPAVIIGHVTFQISFVTLTVRSRLSGLPANLDEAACDLYSGGWNLFRRVTLPLIMPGITAGALLAFILSLDDFVITYFTAGPQLMTLPVYIYGSQRRGITPEIHALSTVMLLCTVVLVFVAMRFLQDRKGKAAS
ncbi:MAG: ABC transporter permease [Verrucomicrobia bacterium]|nr:MAG: ABC transporter permease [Verrucomicrobiota bacterium]